MECWEQKGHLPGATVTVGRRREVWIKAGQAVHCN
jgi:hypothetical protein